MSNSGGTGRNDVRFRDLLGTLTPWAERLTNFVLEFTMNLNLEICLSSCNYRGWQLCRYLCWREA